ncbi:MAG: TonB-dependent receptor [Verrucomicrobiota bacterium JB022]|nr:TonB-dependent receptor [Verrucomicrobiota bacterium JB022]
MCLFAVAPAIPAQAQEAPVATPDAAQQGTGTVRGRVLNEATGRYLRNARITLAGTDRFVFSNEYGEFTLSGVPAGAQTLSVFYTGLETQQIPVTVVADQSASVRVNLNPARAPVTPAQTGEGDEDIFELEAFEVTAGDMGADALALNEQRFSENLKNVVSTDAFGEVSQGNIGEFMKHMPGVTIEYNGNVAQGVQVRGFSSNFTNVTVDGGQIASAATNSTQNHSRSFGLDQTSINNVSRIEVTKLPTAADSANSLGGSVNLISKSAFEYAQPELNYSAYLSINSNAVNLKSPGPGEHSSFKTLPSVSLSYALPMTDDLGFVFSGASANQFNLSRTNVPTYQYDDLGSDTYLRQVSTRTEQSSTSRNSAGIKADWRFTDNQQLSFSYYGNIYNGISASRRLTFVSGETEDHSTEYVYGDDNDGHITQDGNYQERESDNNTFNLKYTYYGERWEVDAGASYSKSTNSYDDMENGFFRTVNARISGLRVNFDDIDYSTGSVGQVTAFNEAGQPVDITAIDNYELRTVSSSPYESSDTVKEARFNAGYTFDLPARPTFRFGGSHNDLQREIDTYTAEWTYVGPDGIDNGLDEGLAGLEDTNFSGMSPGFNYPGFDYASPWRLYDLYVQHPEYFLQTDQQQYNAIRSRAISSASLNEKITAYYGMLEGWFFNSQLRLVGGVRYEKTEDEGAGYTQDGDVTGDPDAERAEREFTVRGAQFGRSYDGFYPSAHARYNLTDKLVLRVAYAKTIGRPALHNIVPYRWIGENTGENGPPGFVVTSNPGLEPWEADNYDVSLEYYTDNAGVISVGVFRKEIVNFFTNSRQVVDQALMDELGLPEYTRGWEYQTERNGGDARIQGVEFNYEQPLTPLGDWGRHFTLMLNYTYLQLEGENEADFNDFIPRTGNAAVKFTAGKWLAFMKWNYRGRQFREQYDDLEGANEYIRSRLELDLNVEYAVTPWMSLFVAGRNVTNESYEWEVYNGNVAGPQRLTSYSEYGAQYTFGVKGRF